MHDLHAFWFGPLDDEGLATAEAQKRWYTKDPEFDATLRERFGGLRQQVIDGNWPWPDDARGRLLAVILCDQVSRNIHRGTGRMYEADELALSLAEDAIARGDDLQLGPDEAQFLYMPFMHAEDVEAQDRCKALFQALHDRLPEGRARDGAANCVRYADMHRDIVVRFGRFPHRNALLGRESTEAELAFLEEPGSSF